jgi:FAD/FMN-containing dehydrogenase
MDPVALDIMKKIKGMLDPNNILNPGKIWEEEA